jgi:hypothetical protein
MGRRLMRIVMVAAVGAAGRAARRKLQERAHNRREQERVIPPAQPAGG